MMIRPQIRPATIPTINDDVVRFPHFALRQQLIPTLLVNFHDTGSADYRARARDSHHARLAVPHQEQPDQALDNRW